MPNEELTQRGYYTNEGLRGDPFGLYESFQLGATSLNTLIKGGLVAQLPDALTFSFTAFKPPKDPGRAKPDQLLCRRDAGGLRAVAVVEHKAPKELKTDKHRAKAAEQAVFYGLALGLPVAGYTAQGVGFWYVDIEASRKQGKPVHYDDRRPFNAGVLTNLLSGDTDVAKDPTALAETVWQIIWHATKSEPKECLLTFVEVFVLKFLSDNLPLAVLPEMFRFYSLLSGEKAFKERHGVLQIDYYVSRIRPRIKTLFPDNVVADDDAVATLLGLKTVVSKTSIINGFAFLRSSEASLSSFNTTFLQILEAFNAFGPLTTIDPEFKLRLYETFLRRSARQQRLGQFFTPRNVVREMVRMARLGELPDGAVVLDPAAGVGGFVLEPLLFEDGLEGNYTFEGGTARRRVTTVGLDVDPDLHILAKANMLLHLAEDVRSRTTTIEALNKAMAATFVLTNENQMLGSLLHPPRNAVDVVLTNPPYVTQGSAVYRHAIAEVQGPRNGVDLATYYDTGGLGVEALFLRHISGSLKPGGRAFVIVPLGMLNRSDPRQKESLLRECNLLASISLPRKAFFNTAQPTYILVLEKRFTDADARPDVFCAIARSTGETLDHRRTPIEHNDLADIADAFIANTGGQASNATTIPVVKIRPPSAFSASSRWDVTRFWTDDELVDLGMRTPPVSREDFLGEVESTLRDLLEEVDRATARLAELKPAATTSVALGDSSLFVVLPGRRVTIDEVQQHPGNLPVYSCFTKADAEKGRVDEEWWTTVKGYPVVEEPVVTVNATGASAVGIVFVREHRCALTDDVISVRPVVADIDLLFLASAVRSTIAAGDFQYEAKLYQGRVKELVVDIPLRADGSFDLELQAAIGAAARDVERVQEKLAEAGIWSKEVRLS